MVAIPKSIYNSATPEAEPDAKERETRLKVVLTKIECDWKGSSRDAALTAAIESGKLVASQMLASEMAGDYLRELFVARNFKVAANDNEPAPAPATIPAPKMHPAPFTSEAAGGLQPDSSRRSALFIRPATATSSAGTALSRSGFRRALKRPILVQDDPLVDKSRPR